MYLDTIYGVVEFHAVCYNDLMTFIQKTCSWLVLTAAMLPPVTAHAYLNPYDVLLSQDLLLPARSREAESRIERQQRESERRRTEELNAVIAEQNPPPVQEEQTVATEGLDDQTFRASAPELNFSEDEFVDREFLSIVRAMERIQENQKEMETQRRVLALLEAEGLRSGAPLAGKGFLHTNSSDLAPTGAGTFVALFAVVFAVFWTLRKARKDDQHVIENLPSVFQG